MIWSYVTVSLFLLTFLMFNNIDACDGQFAVFCVNASAVAAVCENSPFDVEIVLLCVCLPFNVILVLFH